MDAVICRNPRSLTMDQRCFFVCVTRGKIDAILQESLAEPPTVTQGAWITRALYYRHRKLDELLSDMVSEVDSAEAMGGAVIMRTLSRSSSMSSSFGSVVSSCRLAQSRSIVEFRLVSRPRWRVTNDANHALALFGGSARMS